MASHYLHAPSFAPGRPPFSTSYLPPPPESGVSHPPWTTLGPGVQAATGLGLHYFPGHCYQFQRGCPVTEFGPRHSLGLANHGHESGWGALNQRPSLPSFASLVASLEAPPESFAQTTRQPSTVSSASNPPSADLDATAVSYSYAAPVHHHRVAGANHYPARFHAHDVQTAPAPQATTSHVRAGAHGKTRSSSGYRRKYRPPKTDQKRRPKLPKGSRVGEEWWCPAGRHCPTKLKTAQSLKRHLGLVGRRENSACLFFRDYRTNREIWASCANIGDLAPFKVIAAGYPPLPGAEA